MIIILFKSLGKRTSIGSYYDEKSLTKCYWDGDEWLFCSQKSHSSPSLVVPSLFGTPSFICLIFMIMLFMNVMQRISKFIKKESK